MNRKGNIIALGILGILVLLLIFGGVLMVIGGGAITFTMDTLEEVTSDLGMAGEDVNLSEYSDVSIKPVNDTVQMFKWGSGILLILGFLGIIIFASSIRANPSGFLIGLYLLIMLIMVICAIFASNIYEDFLDGSDEIATELKQNTAASFIILYMPMIVTIIGFIGGIIIFSGAGEGFVT